MSTPDSVFPVTRAQPSGNIIADSLISQYQWGNLAGEGVTLTYSFGTAGVSTYQPFYATPDPGSAWTLSDTAKDAIRTAFAHWSAVANISLIEVPDTGDSCGDIRIGGSAAPSIAYTIMPHGTLPEGGDIWFGLQFADPGLSWEPGSYAYLTAVHEIGHALGLKHPHETDGVFPAAPREIDAQQYTVMSYRSTPSLPADFGYWQSRFPNTPMVNDVLAIQQLYGANMTTNAGNTVYSWQPGEKILETIWDAGGHDTIDWSNQTTPALISLVPGTYSNLGPTWTAGFTLKTATLGIAYDTWIEAAIGGSGNDMLIGNSRDNQLYGGDGDDTLSGGGGNDLLDGGNGFDTALFSGAFHDYTIMNTAPNEVTVSGRDGVSILRNIEHLSFGNIVMAPNPDAAPGTWANTFFSIGSVSSSQTLLQQAAAYAGPVDFLQWQWIGTNASEAVAGTDGNDFIHGLAGNDALVGGGGDDVIDGGTGSNFLVGGSGHDTFFLDGRSGQPVWSTITDIEAGEMAVLWGWQNGTSSLTWEAMAGAEGSKGATANVDFNGDGIPDACLTFSGKPIDALTSAVGQGYLSIWALA